MIWIRRALEPLVAACVAAGCGSADGRAGSAGLGQAVVAGNFGTTSFDDAPSAFWIGHPDDPNTIAMYLSARPMTCDEATNAGWSQVLPPGMDILEMILEGTSPGVYMVTATLALAPGDAEVNFIVPGPVLDETRAVSGTVGVSRASSADGVVAGLFDVSWLDGSRIRGSFSAAECANGHELHKRTSM
jgi:hypothetical protein